MVMESGNWEWYVLDTKEDKEVVALKVPITYLYDNTVCAGIVQLYKQDEYNGYAQMMQNRIPHFE